MRDAKEDSKIQVELICEYVRKECMRMSNECETDEEQSEKSEKRTRVREVTDREENFN